MERDVLSVMENSRYMTGVGLGALVRGSGVASAIGVVQSV
jgi:hypothetical protein